ncbi:MAG: RDD family protein [Planctomycetota bacterium]|nr:RDD family protein [Planctomycetota bacterium]
METETTRGQCGLCGLEARGSEHPTLFGHVVHEKCKYKFVLSRELAWVIDASVVYLLVGHALRFVMSQGMTPSEVEESSTMLLVELALLFAFTLEDSIRGISLGKLVTGLQVVDTRTGHPIGLLQSLQRNLIVLVPLAPIVLAFQMRGGPRFGEGWAHTHVIQRARRDMPAFTGTRAVAEDWSSPTR